MPEFILLKEGEIFSVLRAVPESEYVSGTSHYERYADGMNEDVAHEVVEALNMKASSDMERRHRG